MSRKVEPTPGDTSWFVQDRFGLFIHWGIYSSAARHEWVKNRERIADEDYQEYFERFDPDLYDPAAWARAAKDAGMRYMVVTTKHHDGFCLFDSDLTDYKAPNTPAKRDLIKPLVDAFRAEGMKIGFYHSLIDWHHPSFPVDGLHPMRDDVEFREKEKGRDIRKYAEYLHGQVRELLTNYGKVDVMWFDFSYAGSDWGWAKGKGKEDWQAEKLIAMVRELQPGIVINNRADIPQDIFTPEQWLPRAHVQVDGKPVVWEACQTLNGSWGYDRDNLDWKPADMLVQMLVDCVSKGGNMLLNVGPTARGEFCPRSCAVLSQIGEWMRLHGRSVYGCTESELQAPSGTRFTQNGRRLYVHLFDWPLKHVHLDGLAGKVEYAQLLNDASEIRTMKPPAGGGNTAAEAGEGTLTLVLPVQKPDVVVPVVELFLKD